MNKGGYFLIDCKGLNLLSETEQTISGITKECEKARVLDKPCYATNCKWGSEPITPIAVLITKAEGHITATASTLQLVIDNTDGVTINNLVS